MVKKTVTKEAVVHPEHYMGNNGVEVYDVIDGFELGYDAGSCAKYLLRAGRKDPSPEGTLRDYRKAREHLNRLITEADRLITELGG